jgi:hypothetical protein
MGMLSDMIVCAKNADVAQLVEQLTRNEQVACSSHVISSQIVNAVDANHKDPAKESTNALTSAGSV